MLHFVRATLPASITRYRTCWLAKRTITAAGGNNKTHNKVLPQIKTLEKQLQNRQKAVEASKLKCEVAQQHLQKHLQGLQRLDKRGGAAPVWLVTKMNQEPYDEKLPHCCGAFTNKEDAELRRELLQTSTEDQLSYGWGYYVVCVCVDSADATYQVDLEDDSSPGLVS